VPEDALYGVRVCVGAQLQQLVVIDETVLVH
jgi:hypothetical protein